MSAEDTTDAVVGTVGGLLAELSRQLIESTRDAAIRSEMARGLTSVIASPQ